MHVIKYLEPTECTPPKVNPNVNNGLWVVMMCQCRFTSYNKCTTLVQDVDSGGGYVRVGARDGNSLNFLLNFESKTSLTKSFLLNPIYSLPTPKFLFTT